MPDGRVERCKEVDEIVVLDAGRVVQRGAHAELIARPGLYRTLWECSVPDAHAVS